MKMLRSGSLHSAPPHYAVKSCRLKQKMDYWEKAARHGWNEMAAVARDADTP